MLQTTRLKDLLLLIKSAENIIKILKPEGDTAIYLSHLKEHENISTVFVCSLLENRLSNSDDVEDRRGLYIPSVPGSMWCFNLFTQKTKLHSES